jgi:hypothetical protein
MKWPSSFAVCGHSHLLTRARDVASNFIADQTQFKRRSKQRGALRGINRTPIFNDHRESILAICY